MLNFNANVFSFLAIEGVKGHMAPLSLVPEILQDLASRGMTATPTVVGGDRFALDFGGMMIVGEPTIDVEIDGLTVSVFARHLDAALRLAVQAPDRGGYVKLHGAWTCLVLTLHQRDQLVIELTTLACF